MWTGENLGLARGANRFKVTDGTTTFYAATLQSMNIALAVLNGVEPEDDEATEPVASGPVFAFSDLTVSGLHKLAAAEGVDLEGKTSREDIEKLLIAVGVNDPGAD